jgi:N-acyl-D-aspartate/D-glutamate deacylase
MLDILIRNGWVADGTGKDPWDCFFDVLATAGPRLEACGMVGRHFTEEHKADVVVFDFEGLQDVSTLENPVACVKGAEHVLVSGVPVVAHSEQTGARPGRNLLRHSQS